MNVYESAEKKTREAEKKRIGTSEAEKREGGEQEEREGEVETEKAEGRKGKIAAVFRCVLASL